jgi:hypothetical protein
LKVLLLPLGLLALVAAAFGRRSGDEWDWEVEEPDPEQELPPAALVRSRRPSSRIAVAAMFTTLFFAGAVFTAGAGDQMAKVLDDDAAALAELDEIEAARESAAAEPAAEPAAQAPADLAAAPVAAEPVTAPASEPAAEVPAEAAAPPVADEEADLAPEIASEEVAPAPAEPTAASTPVASASVATPAKAASRTAPPPVKPRATKKWVVNRAKIAPTRAPEIEQDHGYGEPTVWLNRALPDPTPPSARLTRSFAKDLFTSAKRHEADWAAVLGVLRAQGERGPAPATAPELESVAARLAGGQAWRGALALSGRTDFADRAESLADLYRSIGIETLVTGYATSKDRLAKRLLDNEDVLLYMGGREDVAAGRIDVRILVLLGYLAERHGSIAVSSLFSGHRTFARPGVVSAHMYGQAVDVAAVDGTSIAGQQQPGGLTEATVRSVLLLPTELQPQQVISLLGLGGPSFPMRDHGDHIHIGY